MVPELEKSAVNAVNGRLQRDTQGSGSTAYVV